MRRILEELHDELEAIDHVDGDAQDLLREVMTDIGQLLERSEAGTEEHRGSLATRLGEVSRQFEDAYPSLVAVVGRLVDALSKMGV